jgi:hypothetical protein
MEKSMVSVLVVENAGGGSLLPCGWGCHCRTAIHTGPIATSHLQASCSPSLLASLSCSGLLSQSPFRPSLPLSPCFHWCCESKIAIPQHNLDIDTSALDDFCPSLLSGGGVRLGLVGVLSPPTILHCWGIVCSCRSPFVVRLVILPLLPHRLSLHGSPSFILNAITTATVTPPLHFQQQLKIPRIFRRHSNQQPQITLARLFQARIPVFR